MANNNQNEEVRDQLSSNNARSNQDSPPHPWSFQAANRPRSDNSPSHEEDEGEGECDECNDEYDVDDEAEIVERVHNRLLQAEKEARRDKALTPKEKMEKEIKEKALQKAKANAERERVKRAIEADKLERQEREKLKKEQRDREKAAREAREAAQRAAHRRMKEQMEREERERRGWGRE